MGTRTWNNNLQYLIFHGHINPEHLKGNRLYLLDQAVLLPQPTDPLPRVALDIAADFEVEALKRCTELHDLLKLKKNIDSSHLHVQTNVDILQSSTTRVVSLTNTQANTITPTHEEVNVGSIIIMPTGTITKNDFIPRFKWQRQCNWRIHAW
jgi:hypothetical protein